MIPSESRSNDLLSLDKDHYHFVNSYNVGLGSKMTFPSSDRMLTHYVDLEASTNLVSEEDCGVLDYTPADVITTDLPSNQFLLTNLQGQHY